MSEGNGHNRNFEANDVKDEENLGVKSHATDGQNMTKSKHVAGRDMNNEAGNTNVLTCCFMPWKKRSVYALSDDDHLCSELKGSDSSRPVCIRMSKLNFDEEGTENSSNSIPDSEDVEDATTPAIVTQIDYMNYFIPKMVDIVNCSFYWGKIDRYEAEALLDNRPEGSFLLRDSAQDEHVFSVSFRRYNRSLHARIEESKHKFSFDCHDPGVHSSPTVSGLLEYYKEPLSCMFFEPMLLHPVNRKNVFSLQELARSVVCDNCSYNGVSLLPLPKTLKDFLREYNYKHKIRSRQISLK